MSARRENDLTILLLEHDEADIFFFRRALAQCRFPGQIGIVGSVGEARDYLQGRGKFADRSYYRMPDLIVSDYKVPGATGLDFLQWLKEQDGFSEIPFVMYSGSCTQDESVETLARGALAFLRKEMDMNDAVNVVREILSYLPTPD